MHVVASAVIISSVLWYAVIFKIVLLIIWQPENYFNKHLSNIRNQTFDIFDRSLLICDMWNYNQDDRMNCVGISKFFSAWSLNAKQLL